MRSQLNLAQTVANLRVDGGWSPSSALVAQAVARAGRSDVERWLEQVHSAGCCVHPVRLAGTVTAVDRTNGERRTLYTTALEPDRVLFKACETRRATRCPACAAMYRGDARALVLAGLTGGKGMPATVADHPVAFLTLTAPSFGAVHTPGPRMCRAGAPSKCLHGSLTTCHLSHGVDDHAVGTPLCMECYDYAGTVVFNACAPRLWSRTTIALRRVLATEVGMSCRSFDRQYRLSFVRVIEYQRRGVVHLHALIRLDKRDGGLPELDVGTLAIAVTRAALRVQAPNPLRADRPLRWGTQREVAPVDVDERRIAANYLAKYATKSTDDDGALDRRLRHGDSSRLAIPEHLRRLVDTAWRLGSRPEFADLRLREWAHTLGFPGHWVTKSRHWSTTFTDLRAARHAWRLDRSSAEQPPSDERTEKIASWEYRGSGYRTAGDAWLAASAAANKLESRRLAWEEMTTTQAEGR